MNEIAKEFANFFQEKFEDQSGLSDFLPRTVPIGFLDSARAEIFRDPNTHKGTKLKTGELWADISGSVYESVEGVLAVVLAYYDDGVVLWLDNHEDNADFEVFAQSEKLVRWLPDRLPELLALLIETKFNYLGWPELINRVEDLPIDRDKDFEEDRSLERAGNNILTQIQAPTCKYRRNELFELTFFLWTRIGGKLFKVKCFIGAEYFTFESFQLANRIGQYVVIR